MISNTESNYSKPPTEVGPDTALDLARIKGYIECTLTLKTPITHDTCLYRFGLPKPDICLGLPLGQHISLIAII